MQLWDAGSEAHRSRKLLLLPNTPPPPPPSATFVAFQNFVTSATAGAVAQCILYPMETAKTRIAVSATGEYDGLFDCIRQSYKRGGIMDFYKGLGANLCGIVPYRGLEVGCFYALSSRIQDGRRRRRNPAAPLSDEDKLTIAEIAGVGLCSSVMAQTVTYPLNLIRTRLQTQGVNGRPVLYRGMFDGFRKVLRSDGPAGLFRGLTANYLKAVPASVTTFIVLDMVQNNLSRVS